MSKYRRETPTHIEYDLWLVFDFFGPVKVTKQEPDLTRNERAMFIRARLPKALFNIPSLRATLSVEEGVPPVLDVTAVAEAVKSATGLDFDIKISEPTS